MDGWWCNSVELGREVVEEVGGRAGSQAEQSFFLVSFCLVSISVLGRDFPVALSLSLAMCACLQPPPPREMQP